MNRLKRTGFITLAWIVTLFLTSCSGAKPSNDQNPSPATTPANSFKTKVMRVVDGDTFHIAINGKDETVRLLLVDTPETHKPNTAVQPFGPEAEAFTRKLIEGKEVEIERDVGGDARDKYGRLLYYVYVDGKSVQEELLRQGLARVAYIFPPNVKYVDQYKAIQAEVQKKGIGIWSIENYALEDGYHPEVAGKKVEPAPAPSPSPKPPQGKPDKPLIKGNINNQGEKIYHVPGGQFYEKTNAEEWFDTEEEAKAAGYRPSKR